MFTVGMAANRDGLEWAVDISTVVVGAATVVTLAVGIWALRRDRKEHARAWSRQIALDHHARIYEAAAELTTVIVRFCRRASDRTQARGTARVDLGYTADGDESVDLDYARALDRIGGPPAAVVEAHDEVLAAIERLWFLIPSTGDGQHLLNDLVLLRQVHEAMRPTIGTEAGKGDLTSTIDASGLRFHVEMSVDLDHLAVDEPMGRIKFLRDLATRYMSGRIGRFVQPPPLADLDAK